MCVSLFVKFSQSIKIFARALKPKVLGLFKKGMIKNLWKLQVFIRQCVHLLPEIASHKTPLKKHSTAFFHLELDILLYLCTTTLYFLRQKPLYLIASKTLRNIIWAWHYFDPSLHTIFTFNIYDLLLKTNFTWKIDWGVWQFDLLF